MSHVRRLSLLVLAVALIHPGFGQPPSLKDKLPPIPSRSPADSLKALAARDGFRLSLVAHEPQVVDPVAAAYDEDGRLYVVEMRDYPDPPEPGKPSLGRVRLLTDADGDGVYESATVLADGLPWPTSVCCWDGGVFVTAAPDIWFLKDTDGDGRADIKERVFTGFVVHNVQALVNGLQWGVDNKIYGVTAGNGGSITAAASPAGRSVSVRGRDFRFDPRTLTFEAISGTAQFGNTFDDWYNRFVCANRLVAGHVAIPSEYLARNPHLAAGRVIQDCAAEGENVPLPMFQISPPEPWRVVRTQKYHDEGTKLPPSEMVATGLFTSGTGVTVYRGDAYPAKYRGNLFVGNVAGNLVHRRVLTPKGATFTATRADEKSEFVASADNWFRPCNMVNAPDGTLHVLDMYREVVEHPWSIPDDIKRHLDLTSGRDKGRIYRLAPPNFTPPAPPKLGRATTAELVRALEHPNAWWRETAQRLLIQKGDPAAVPPLRQLTTESRSPLARLHALWTLDGFKRLDPEAVLACLRHDEPGLREHAVRLAEPRLAGSPELSARVGELANDPSARVRFQVALTLGTVRTDRATDLLAGIAVRDAADPWLRLAVASSAAGRELRLIDSLVKDERFVASPPGVATLRTLAAVVGARHTRGEPEAVLERAAGQKADAVRRAVVTGVADGLMQRGRTLRALTLRPDSAAAALVSAVLGRAVAAAATDPAAVPLLAHVPFAESRPVLEKLLDPRQPQGTQVAAVRAARAADGEAVPELLLSRWKAFSPAVRNEVLATLAARPVWAAELVRAVGQKRLAATDVGPSTRSILLGHRDAKVRAEATRVFAAPTAGRSEVLNRYKPALEGKGDAGRGLAVFKRECASCHFAAGVGKTVGPAIASIGTRTPEVLLTAILDPNKEVDPRFLTYVVNTTDGRAVSGVIAAETATSVTLRRADGVTDTVLRTQIEDLKSSGVSLMPDGLEQKITPAEMADLIAFLLEVR